MHNASIMNSYATGSVSSASDTPITGGLVGHMQANSSIINSYATGSATAAGDLSDSGGLAGSMLNSSIMNSYATGSVTGTIGSSNSGGLVGRVSGSISGRNYYRDAKGTNGVGIGGTCAAANCKVRTVTELQALTIASSSTGWSAYYDNSDSYAIKTDASFDAANGDVRLWNFTANRLPILNNKPGTATIFTAHEQYLQQGLSFISATPTAITAGRVTGNSITLSHPAGTAVTDLPNDIVNLAWSEEDTERALGPLGTDSTSIAVTRPASNLEDAMATLIATLRYVVSPTESYSLERRFPFVIAKQ